MRESSSARVARVRMQLRYSIFALDADPARRTAAVIERLSARVDDDALADVPDGGSGVIGAMPPELAVVVVVMLNDELVRRRHACRRSLRRSAEINRLLSREHLRRHDVVAAERAAPHGVGRLLIARRHQVRPAADDSAEDRVNQLGRNIEKVAEQGARAITGARPVDVIVGRLRHLRRLPPAGLPVCAMRRGVFAPAAPRASPTARSRSLRI